MSGRVVVLRWVELVALFALVPLGFLVVLLHHPTAHIALIPLLWVVAAALLYVLSFQDGWEHRSLMRLPPSSEALRRVLVRFAFVGTAMALVTYIVSPEDFLRLPLSDPWMMLAIGVLYPALSVIPQGIIYRVFMSERYSGLFRSETSFVLFTAACFAAGHVIFRNWVAVAATFFGGLIFMRTYRLTRSHLLASFEHALYGVSAFAIGIGRFLILAAA
ncbi:MAG TPA: CPBP family glutamic-type intramembrane protease [Polyangiaceae bacterium]|nr:CPBP family glutamic-type intramembrane protease [Polyangiaceae bacterium]